MHRSPQRALGRRVVVVGDSCSGKSTLANLLAQERGCPVVELDALYWGPGWTHAEPEAFCAAVDAATRGSAWVLAGNYGVQRGVSWPRADAVVWLDFPLRITLARIVARSWRRWHRGELLWGTNHEKFWRQFRLWAPHDSLIAFTLQHHGALRQRYLAALHDEAYAHLHFDRLRSPRALERWLRELGLDPARLESVRTDGAAPS